MNSDPSMYYEKAHKIAEQKYSYSEALLASGENGQKVTGENGQYPPGENGH